MAFLMDKAQIRSNFEDVLLSLSEIFFVNRWKLGLVLWIILFLLYPVPGLVGLLASICAALLHALLRVTISIELRRWLMLNAALVGFGYVAMAGFSVEPGYWLVLAGLIFLHQIVYYVLLATLNRQQLLPLLTTSFIIIIKGFAVFSPRPIIPPVMQGWIGFGPLLNAELAEILPGSLLLFLDSLGALLFLQDASLGLAVCVVIMMYSPILFSLAVLGFIPVALASVFLPPMIGWEIISFNVMLTVMIIGSVLEVPSLWAYRNSLVFGIFAGILSFALADSGVLVLNLPFVAAVYAYLYAKSYIGRGSAPVLDFAAGTPEENLYYAQNRGERYGGAFLPSFALPFNGEWKVTQGHRGPFTHKNDWQHAWDFEKTDAAGNISRDGALRLADFYSYRQPVCAVLEGEVANLQSHIPDNEIGHFNFGQNWGNTVVLRHPTGHCSAYSHLSDVSPGIIPGRWVQKGEVIGYCGNSGRSDRPHLHFQFQSVANIGEKTLTMPFKKYLVRTNGTQTLRICNFPEEGESVSNLVTSPRIADVFTIPFGRGFIVEGVAGGENIRERWIATVDFYNRTYLYCYERKSVAYYFSQDGVFYFSDYFGPRDSLLYYFTLASSRVVFTEHEGLIYDDRLPLNRVRRSPWNGLTDVLAPFMRVREIVSRFSVRQSPDRTITLGSEITAITRMPFRRSDPIASFLMNLQYGVSTIRVQGTMRGSDISFIIQRQP